jgi:hypothetical protein
MAYQFHGDRARDAGPFQAADGGPAEVVRDLPHEPGVLAGRAPCLPDTLDGFPLAVEHPADHLACSAFYGFGISALGEEETLEVGGVSSSIPARSSSPSPGHVAYRRGVRLVFIRPGKPVDNAYIESLHGRFRDECLNESWFWDLPDARRQIETWRRDYNEVRPHESLRYRTPREFAEAFTHEG